MYVHVNIRDIFNLLCMDLYPTFQREFEFEELYVEEESGNRRSQRNVETSGLRKIKQRIAIIVLSIITSLHLLTPQPQPLSQSQTCYIILRSKQIFEKQQKNKKKWATLKQSYHSTIDRYFLLCGLPSRKLFQMGISQIIAFGGFKHKHMEEQEDIGISDGFREFEEIFGDLGGDVEEMLRNDGQIHIHILNEIQMMLQHQQSRKMIQNRLKDENIRKKKKINGKKHVKKQDRTSKANQKSSTTTKLKQRLILLYLLKFPYILETQTGSPLPQKKMLCLTLSLIDLIHFENNTHSSSSYSLPKSLAAINEHQFYVWIINLIHYCPLIFWEADKRVLLSHSFRDNREQQKEVRLAELGRAVEWVQQVVWDKGFYSSYGGEGCLLRAWAWIIWIKKNICIILSSIVNIVWISTGIKFQLTLQYRIQTILNKFSWLPKLTSSLCSPCNILNTSDTYPFENYSVYNWTSKNSSSMMMNCSSVPYVAGNSLLLFGIAAFIILLPTLICICIKAYSQLPSNINDDDNSSDASTEEDTQAPHHINQS